MQSQLPSGPFVLSGTYVLFTELDSPIINNLRAQIADQEHKSHILTNQYKTLNQQQYTASQLLVQNKITLAAQQQKITTLTAQLITARAEHAALQYIPETTLDAQESELQERIDQLMTANQTLQAKISTFKQQKADWIKQTTIESMEPLSAQYTSEMNELDLEHDQAAAHLDQIQTDYKSTQSTFRDQCLQKKEALTEFTRSVESLEEKRMQLEKLYDRTDTLIFATLDPIMLSDLLLHTSSNSFRAALHWRLAFISKHKAQPKAAVQHFYWAYQANKSLYQAAPEAIQAIICQEYGNKTDQEWQQLLAYSAEQNNTEDTIFYALQAIQSSNESIYGSAYVYLISAYTYKEEWYYIDNIYLELHNRQRSSTENYKKTTNKLLETIQKKATEYSQTPSFTNHCKLLQIISMAFFQQHLNLLTKKLTPALNIDPIFNHNVLRKKYTDPTPQYAVTINIILMDFYCRRGLNTEAQQLLTEIQNSTNALINPFYLSWVHYIYAHYSETINELQTAATHYASALQIQSAFCAEARQGLAKVTNNAINAYNIISRHAFFYTNPNNSTNNKESARNNNYGK